MKITAIIEDSEANVVSVVIDDSTTHPISTPFPRRQLADIGAHVAQLEGYRLDIATLELSPIAPTVPDPTASQDAHA